VRPLFLSVMCQLALSSSASQRYPRRKTSPYAMLSAGRTACGGPVAALRSPAKSVAGTLELGDSRVNARDGCVLGWEDVAMAERPCLGSRIAPLGGNLSSLKPIGHDWPANASRIGHSVHDWERNMGFLFQ
jgi:hypothetical protein